MYNGAPLSPGANPTLAFIMRRAGRPVGELDFAVRPSSHGLLVGQVLIPAAGPGIGITKVSLTIPERTVRVRAGRRMSTVPFLTAPTTCTGAWTFGLTTTSAGRKPIVASDREPCVPADDHPPAETGAHAPGSAPGQPLALGRGQRLVAVGLGAAGVGRARLGRRGEARRRAATR